MMMVVMVDFLGLLTTLGLPHLLHVLGERRKRVLGSLEITFLQGSANCHKVIIQRATSPGLLTILRLAHSLQVLRQRLKGYLGALEVTGSKACLQGREVFPYLLERARRILLVNGRT
jgi:hypothetical protein